MVASFALKRGTFYPFLLLPTVELVRLHHKLYVGHSSLPAERETGNIATGPHSIASPVFAGQARFDSVLHVGVLVFVLVLEQHFVFVRSNV